MNNHISVIIPVYNVSSYLPECLNSILTQDYSDLEIILIDDGSTDSSGKICDDYAAKDRRIRVIHQNNSGAAAAKNAGLRIASGKYLSFVDSDDVLEAGAYSHMLQLMHCHAADVVQCSYRDIFRTETVDHIKTPQLFDAQEYVSRFTADWTCGLLWDKLYHRKLFDGIFFEEGHKIDDEYFTYQGILNAQTIVCDNQIVYNYRKRRSSVMFSPASGTQILLDRIDYLSKRRINVIRRFPELRKTFDTHFLNMLVILSKDSHRTSNSFQMIRQSLYAYFHEKGRTIPDLPLWPALIRILVGDEPSSPQSNPSEIDTEKYFD